jgi:hypothetical protein
MYKGGVPLEHRRHLPAGPVRFDERTSSQEPKKVSARVLSHTSNGALFATRWLESLVGKRGIRVSI